MFSFLNKNEEGQGLVEYALILVLVAVVSIVALALVGPAISDVYCETIVELGMECDSGGEEEEEQPCASTADYQAWVSSMNNTCSSYSGQGNWVAFSCNAETNTTNATCWHGGDGFNTPSPANIGTYNH